jgi:hypothetical protein
MINSILLPVYAGLLCYGVYDIKHDKEYRISLTSNEILSLMMAYITSSLLLLVVSLQTAIFLTAAMTFLHISAVTDTKTHMITFGYIYVFVPIAIICELWQAGRFSCWT